MLKLFHQGKIFMIILAISSFQGNLERALANNDPIPMPGDSIPLPGEDRSPSAPASSQSLLNFPFELRGYVETTTTGEYVKQLEEERLLNVTRARVDLAGEPDEALDFGIGVVGMLSQGATTAHFDNYLPERIRRRLIPGVEHLLTYQVESEDLFVQEAFGTLYTDYGRLRVGRHKFYTGTGYAYNPIDLLNPKNPLDPTYETAGLDALLVTVDLPHQTQLQGLVRYNDRLKNSDYVARVKTYLNGWDLALQYTHSLKKRIDWERVNSEEALAGLGQGIPIDTYIREFRWHLVGAEFAGEALGFGVYGEGGYVFVDALNEARTLANAAKDHERLLIGFDRTFDMQVYLMAEYLRFGQGITTQDELSLNEYMAFFSGEQIAIGRDTLFTGVSYPLTDLLEGSLYAITNLNDGSGLLNPWLIYDIRPGLKLSATLNIPWGAEESINGNIGISGFVRLKLNF